MNVSFSLNRRSVSASNIPGGLQHTLKGGYTMIRACMSAAAKRLLACIWNKGNRGSETWEADRSSQKFFSKTIRHNR